jgi:hypothetical protein
MSAEKRHPHIDTATEDQLAEVLHDKSPELREVYLEAHRLMLNTLPEVRFATDCTDGGTGYGASQYGYDAWGLAALMAHSRWVSLAFFRGTDLEDPAGLLEGTGKLVRHVKLRTVDQIAGQREGLRGLIETAARINER